MLAGPHNDLYDTSEPLFSLYAKTVEGNDSNKAERHEKDAEGIVIFVSRLHTNYTPWPQLKTNDRLACSQPLSPH